MAKLYGIAMWRNSKDPFHYTGFPLFAILACHCFSLNKERAENQKLSGSDSQPAPEYKQFSSFWKDGRHVHTFAKIILYGERFSTGWTKSQKNLLARNEVVIFTGKDEGARAILNLRISPCISLPSTPSIAKKISFVCTVYSWSFLLHLSFTLPCG